MTHVVTDRDKWEAEAVVNIWHQFGKYYAAEEIARIRDEAKADALRSVEECKEDKE